MNPDSTNFKILLIASEIIIPAIVFIGAYYIFKPLMQPKEDLKNKENENDNTDVPEQGQN